MKKDSLDDLAMFMKIMGSLAEEFGGKLSTDNMKVRFNIMCGYSIKQISDAAITLFKTREATFPRVPTTKEMVDIIESKISPKIGIETRSVIEADKVIEKLKKDGRNAEPDFDDPITYHLMTRQWPYYDWASNVMEKELTWWKKEFIAAYEAYGNVDKEKAKLVGRIEDIKKIEIISENIFKNIDAV